jgi:hypothetical protein
MQYKLDLASTVTQKKKQRDQSYDWEVIVFMLYKYLLEHLIGHNHINWYL